MFLDKRKKGDGVKGTQSNLNNGNPMGYTLAQFASLDCTGILIVSLEHQVSMSTNVIRVWNVLLS